MVGISRGLLPALNHLSAFGFNAVEQLTIAQREQVSEEPRRCHQRGGLYGERPTSNRYFQALGIHLFGVAPQKSQYVARKARQVAQAHTFRAGLKTADVVFQGECDGLCFHGAIILGA